VQHVAAADGITGHQGNHRLGHGTDNTLQLQHVQPGHAVIAYVAGVAAHALVAAGAKGVLAVGRRAVAGQQDHADFLIHPGVAEGIDHLIDGQRPEGVARLRAIEGDAGHAVRLVIGDIGILFDDLPIGHSGLLLVDK